MLDESSRYEDAKEVLADAERLIAELSVTYAKAVSDEEVLLASKTHIKGAVEGVRSALEYTSQDIWRSYTTKKNSVYFPYGKDEAAFLVSVKRNLPALKEQAPLLFDLVESIQPFITGESWLSELCTVSNFNKHNGLSGQLRKNSPGNRVEFGFGGIVIEDCEDVTILNSSVNGVPIGKNGAVKFSSSSSTSFIREQLNEALPFNREFDWVEFHIDITGSDALLMLKKAHFEVSDFVEKVHKEIGKSL